MVKNNIKLNIINLLLKLKWIYNKIYEVFIGFRIIFLFF